MAEIDYIGRCGSCRFCDLGEGFLNIDKMKFWCEKCEINVTADNERCDNYTPSTRRSNAIISVYDK